MKFKNKLNQFARSIVIGIMSSIAKLIPSKKGLWLFGAWAGNLYSDNSRYLFEYIIKNHPEINAKWITRNKEIYHRLSKIKYPCTYKYSFWGLWYCLRAEACFVTSCTVDINPIINPKKTLVFNLWHGLGVKDVKWKDENGNEPKAESYSYMKDYYWCGTSQYFIDTLSAQYYQDPDNFFITGFPRNDVFVNKPQNPYFSNLLNQYKGKRLILYMPTHRNFGTEGNKAINIKELTILDKKLKKENCILIFKPHYYEVRVIEKMGGNFSNIIFAKDQNIWGDPYQYLPFFDGLISDYSSVASDFICSGKPVVLFPYDIEHYKASDGGILPIFWNTPTGPCCYSWDEVITTMINLFDNDSWHDKREECRKKYHVYNDGNNCKRVYMKVMEILKTRRKS